MRSRTCFGLRPLAANPQPVELPLIDPSLANWTGRYLMIFLDFFGEVHHEWRKAHRMRNFGARELAGAGFTTNGAKNASGGWDAGTRGGWLYKAGWTTGLQARMFPEGLPQRA